LSVFEKDVKLAARENESARWCYRWGMLVLSRSAAAVALAIGLLPVAGPPGRAADLSATELAAALQKKYDAVKDFSADFTHVYRGGVLRKQLTERGRVLVKKPGKMRWEYTAPEEKLFVSDGVKVYSYLPLDKQVIVSSVPPDDEASTPALFLAGKGNLTRDFTASIETLPDGMPPGARALKLVPRNAQRDYESLVLVVDPASYQIRGLITVDAQGGKSSFSFANLKENVGLPDATFAFKIPRGVDVVSTASRQ
jgi:outer membrane lipoprotein carrier protein